MGTPAPAPRTWDPFYEDKRYLTEWLEGERRAQILTFDMPRWLDPDVPGAKPTHFEVQQVVLQKRRAYGFAPYVGDPFVYVWRFATDQYGRSIAGEAHIHYLPWEPWMP